jgi:hypothetical protein
MEEKIGSSVLQQVPNTTIEYQVRFWRVQMSTPHYESAISCVARPSGGPLGLENCTFLTPDMAIQKSNVYGLPNWNLNRFLTPAVIGAEPLPRLSPEGRQHCSAAQSSHVHHRTQRQGVSAKSHTSAKSGSGSGVGAGGPGAGNADSIAERLYRNLQILLPASAGGTKRRREVEVEFNKRTQSEYKLR